jgi:hypothetical protein
MLDWLRQLSERLGMTPRQMFWDSVLLFVVMLLGSLVVVTFVLVKLPSTYYVGRHGPPMFGWAERHPALRWAVLIGKNVLGVLLVIAGVLLSLPLIPGQGFLTIILGIMLLNFPGKRRLERRLVSRPRILRAINGLRARFGKPPLVMSTTPEVLEEEDPDRMQQV